jgi:hypothetical protein
MVVDATREQPQSRSHNSGVTKGLRRRPGPALAASHQLRRESTLRARLRYRADTVFSSGTAAMILWLAAITAVLIVTAAFVLAVAHVSVSRRENATLGEGLWLSLLRTLDPGTMGSDQGWPFRIVSLFVTIGGIFVVSTLIGIVATGIDRRLEHLRRGRSAVVEKGHTLVLGTSSKLPAIVAELAEANANQGDACVVVMADVSKVRLEEHLRTIVGDRSTRVLCRTGDPSDLRDLQIVNPRDARSIVVLCPEDDLGDAQVIRSVLALLNDETRLDGVPIVAELSDTRNARALRRATGGRIVTVVSREVIARITAQVCRQQGLSRVYRELLDFAGDEIYFHHVPELVSRTFGEALLSFEQSTVIGVRSSDGTTQIAPPRETVLCADDELIAISADDDTICFTGLRHSPDTTAPEGPLDHARPCERIMVIGWSDLGPPLLRELDLHLGRGSRVIVAVDGSFISSTDVGIRTDFDNVTVELTEIDTTRCATDR